MPYLQLKENDKDGKPQFKYFTKHQIREMRRPQTSWNPEANGKTVKHDDGKIYQILPTGWKRRKDLEALEAMQDKVEKATDTKEIKNGTDKISITRI